MKKITFITLIFMLANLSFIQAQDSAKAENLGLISELVYVKLNSENKALQAFNDSSKTPEKNSFVMAYNDLKVLTDQVILQLITDCRSSNSLQNFKKMDKLLVDKTINQIEPSDLNSLKLKGYIKSFTTSRLN